MLYGVSLVLKAASANAVYQNLLTILICLHTIQSKILRYLILVPNSIACEGILKRNIMMHTVVLPKENVRFFF